MSRGIKDLRDLVVVSRLTYRDSDSESDDGRAGLITPFQSLEIGEPHFDQPTSPTPTPPSSADSGLGRRRKKKKKKPKGYMSTRVSHPLIAAQLHEFPKSRPLPAVGATGQAYGDNSRSASSSSNESISMLNGDSADCSRTDFSAILDYLDETVVSDWLTRTNENLKSLTLWCSDANFVKFAQFWITDFGIEKRCQILELEHSILLDEMSLAFREGIECGKVRQKDISDLLAALFREYPRRLTGSTGVYIFLDYLDIFTSERTTEYRSILSDVKLSSTNKQHVQLVLASRCFMLINVWLAIVSFYRQVCSTSKEKTTPNDIASRTHRDKADTHYARLTDAVNLGLVEAVHYFLYSGKCSAGHVNPRQKTLLHIATAANQYKVVEYLLKKWTGCMDVNRACDTGNTPLHVAVNLGSLNLVQLLLNMPDIEVNKENKDCDGATPLHLAALHGHTDIARTLLKYKADPRKRMGGQTALEIARDFDHSDIVHILESLC